ncbi:MAG: hypothetical protein DRO00_05480 [Thermoproteota archaeon]|nr:MAG: hypothetical protein DRN92_09735 [Candidatus Korarchaeota archaeon]RLG52494.1 MAG: hypothetical protein DRO00_05480 [Candidatus Korarchaeota archaeon]
MEYTVSYSFTSSTYQGKSCWLQEIEMRMEAQGVAVKYRVWLDKDTLVCLKAEMSIGGGPWQSVPCSQAPTGTTGEGESIEIREVGHETVTVPAGTFSCTVYEAIVSTGKARYWVAGSVPIPVKWQVTNAQGTITAELVEWG